MNREPGSPDCKSWATKQSLCPPWKLLAPQGLAWSEAMHNQFLTHRLETYKCGREAHRPQALSPCPLLLLSRKHADSELQGNLARKEEVGSVWQSPGLCIQVQLSEVCPNTTKPKRNCGRRWTISQNPQRNGESYFLSGKVERCSLLHLITGDPGPSVPRPLEYIHFSEPQ